MASSLIPPQIHTFCMETVASDIEYVASRLFYAAIAAGVETATPDTVDRTKYEKWAKVLIPTLSIRRPAPMAEGQVIKVLGSTPPMPKHDVFKPHQYSEIPAMENTQEVAEAKPAPKVETTPPREVVSQTSFIDTAPSNPGSFLD